MGTIYLSTYASVIQLKETIDDVNDDDDNDNDAIVIPSILKFVKNVASQFSCHSYDLSLQYRIDIYRKYILRAIIIVIITALRYTDTTRLAYYDSNNNANNDDRDGT